MLTPSALLLKVISQLALGVMICVAAVTASAQSTGAGGSPNKTGSNTKNTGTQTGTSTTAKDPATAADQTATGKTTPSAADKTGGNDIEVDILSQSSIESIAARIAKTVAEARPSELVIYNEQEVAALQGYRLTNVQLKLLIDQFDQELKDSGPTEVGVTEIPALASGMIKAITDLITLFKTDTEVTYADSKFNDTVLLGSVIQAIRDNSVTKDLTLYVPAIFPPNPFQENAPILVLVGQLQSRVDLTKQKINQLNQITDPKLKDVAAQRAKRLQNLVDSTTSLLSALIGGNAADSKSPLLSLVRAGSLLEHLPDPQAFTLLVKLELSGGSRTVKKSLIRGTRISHSGGAIVSFMLFDRGGNVRSAGTATNYKTSKMVDPTAATIPQQ